MGAVDPMALGQQLGEILVEVRGLKERIVAIEEWINDSGGAVQGEELQGEPSDEDLGGFLGQFEKLHSMLQRAKPFLEKVKDKGVTTNGAAAPTKPVG